MFLLKIIEQEDKGKQFELWAKVIGTENEEVKLLSTKVTRLKTEVTVTAKDFKLTTIENVEDEEAGFNSRTFKIIGALSQKENVKKFIKKRAESLDIQSIIIPE